MLHGAWGNNESLGRFLNRGDRPRCEVYAPNLYGHGSRTEPLHGVSLETYVREVVDLVNYTGEVVLAGHSLGGLVALIAAERISASIRALVLMAPSPPRGIAVPKRFCFFKPWYVWPLFVSKRAYRLRQPEVNRFLGTGFEASELSAESGQASCEVLLGKFKVGSIRVPTLICADSEDQFFPPHIPKAIARKYGAELRLYGGYGGHMFHVGEQQGKVENDIFLWLSQTVR